eukprot:366073-Chlamydomonas_euryale.AAC.3
MIAESCAGSEGLVQGRTQIPGPGRCCARRRLHCQAGEPGDRLCFGGSGISHYSEPMARLGWICGMLARTDTLDCRCCGPLPQAFPIAELSLALTYTALAASIIGQDRKTSLRLLKQGFGTRFHCNSAAALAAATAHATAHAANPATTTSALTSATARKGHYSTLSAHNHALVNQKEAGRA